MTFKTSTYIKCNKHRNDKVGHALNGLHVAAFLKV